MRASEGGIGYSEAVAMTTVEAMAWLEDARALNELERRNASNAHR